MDNMFEQATRNKLRFASTKGELTTEQLWDLPLQSKSGFDLDSIARNVNASLRSLTEESFVETRPSPERSMLALKLDVLKRIIKVKQDENAAALNEAAVQTRLKKLEGALEAAELRDLASKPKEAIEAEIAALKKK